MTEIASIENPLQEHYDLCNAGDSKKKLANLPAFPHMIDLELTNTCNFRCLMCPTGNFSQQRDKGFMSEEVYYSVLDGLGEHNIPIRYIRWGEPLTHPNIVEFLEAAKKKGHLLHVNTNGSKLTDELIDELLAIPLDSIKFSFQGVDKKSYAEMRNIDYFEGLTDTMRRLIERRGELRRPFVQASTTITYETKEQVRAFRELFGGIADVVNVGRTVLEYVDLNAVRLRPDEYEMLKKLKEEESVVRVHPECPEVFDKISVNWDGTVTACCMDSENMMIIGDVRENTIEEIWKCDQLTHYREMLAEMRHDELDLCKSCYDTHGLGTPGLQDTD